MRTPLRHHLAGDDDNRTRISKGGKKRRRHRELVLEEEDYELLEENTGIRRARPAGHRRIKKARETGSRGGGMKELQAELFGDELEGREYRQTAIQGCLLDVEGAEVVSYAVVYHVYSPSTVV